MKLLIHIKSKVQSLRLVTHSVQKWGLKESSFITVQLQSVQFPAAKPAGMSRPWNSSINLSPGQKAAQDQPCSVHFRSLRSTALNHTYKSSSLWLIFFSFHMDVTMKQMSSCSCSVINAVLIKPIEVSWKETPQSLGLFSWTSTPPAPSLGSRPFLRGSSCWRCSRGCCDPGTDSHPPTDQSDHFLHLWQRSPGLL